MTRKWLYVTTHTNSMLTIFQLLLIIWMQNNVGSKTFWDPKFLLIKNFWDQKLLWTQIFFTWIFLTWYFFLPKLFGPKYSLDKKIFRKKSGIQHFLGQKIFLNTNFFYYHADFLWINLNLTNKTIQFSWGLTQSKLI